MSITCSDGDVTSIDVKVPARKVLYRSRDIIPAPLEVIAVSWREHSLLGEGYELPPGGWDTVLKSGEGTITREIHWPNPRIIFRATAHRVTATELKVTLAAVRGHLPVGSILMDVNETLTAAGSQTAWDIEVSNGRGGQSVHPFWVRTRRGVLRGLQAEKDHRLHRMLEDAMESSWGKKEGGMVP